MAFRNTVGTTSVLRSGDLPPPSLAARFSLRTSLPLLHIPAPPAPCPLPPPRPCLHPLPDPFCTFYRTALPLRAAPAPRCSHAPVCAPHPPRPWPWSLTHPVFPPVFVSVSVSVVPESAASPGGAPAGTQSLGLQPRGAGWHRGLRHLHTGSGFFAPPPRPSDTACLQTPQCASSPVMPAPAPGCRDPRTPLCVRHGVRTGRPTEPAHLGPPPDLVPLGGRAPS